MSSKLAILPLIAMVLTIGIVSSADASNWSGSSTFAGDGSDTGNVSENPAVAERSILRANSTVTSKVQYKQFVEITYVQQARKHQYCPNMANMVDTLKENTLTQSK